MEIMTIEDGASFMKLT